MRNAEQAMTQGVSHLALVCSDMTKTVAFYEGVLGMPLVKTMDIPVPGGGQHFFFDCGNGDCLAFFWYARGVPAAPGVAAPTTMTEPSADGSMHHVAFKIEPGAIEGWGKRLDEKGIDYQFVNHKVPREEPYLSRPAGPAATPASVKIGHKLITFDQDSFAASFYMFDPDGALIELCAWLPGWARVVKDHTPAKAGDRPVPVPA